MPNKAKKPAGKSNNTLAPSPLIAASTQPAVVLYLSSLIASVTKAPLIQLSGISSEELSPPCRTPSIPSSIDPSGLLSDDTLWSLDPPCLSFNGSRFCRLDLLSVLVNWRHCSSSPIPSPICSRVKT
jgi:hypothetical protein